MLQLKVINLWCGPGAGKSTTAAGLFNAMKNMGLRVELVTEYAKDLTYEANYGALSNQFFVVAQQDQRLRRLEGQVEWCITDSPLPLGVAYCNSEYGDWLPEAIEGAYDRYDNYDFLLKRCKGYQTYGRSQTEMEALTLDIAIKAVFMDMTVDMETNAWEVLADVNAPLQIIETLIRNGALTL